MARGIYAPKFRRQICGIDPFGGTLEELAREFEPTSQSIRNWVEQTARDAGWRTDGLTTVERGSGGWFSPGRDVSEIQLPWVRMSHPQ